MLHDRTERQGGEETQGPDDDDDTDQEYDKDHPGRRKGAQISRHRLFADQRACYRHRGHDHEDRPASMVRPRVTSYHSVLAFSPANAEPLLPAALL